ncbi:MAG: carbohydrate kinase family protein [Candidatus Berkelbacteria bacterium]
MKYDVVTIGDAFEDVFTSPEVDVKNSQAFGSGQGICFELGDKVPLKWIQYEIGGTACNVAVGLARQGYKTAIVTALGDDSPARRVIDRLKKEKVNCASENIYPGIQTGFSVIFSIDGKRTIFSYHAMKNYELLKIDENIEAEWLYISSLGEGIGDIEKRIVKEVSQNNSKFAWNPGTNQLKKGASHWSHLLRCCTVLFLNKEEARLFLSINGKSSIEEMAKRLHMMGAKIVVITDSNNGADAYNGKELFHIDTNRSIEVVDATGAGDAFATGFVGRLIGEKIGEYSKTVMTEALSSGLKNSQSVIRHIGAQNGLLSKKELE